MDSQTIVERMLSSGRVAEADVARWTDAAALMATFEAIGRDGTSAIFKVDGSRPAEPFTVVLSGPRFGDSFYRKDGSDAFALLRDAISHYSAECWTSES